MFGIIFDLIIISGIFKKSDEELDVLPPPPPFPEVLAEEKTAKEADRARKQQERQRQKDIEVQKKEEERERKRQERERKKEEQKAEREKEAEEKRRLLEKQKNRRLREEKIKERKKKIYDLLHKAGLVKTEEEKKEIERKKEEKRKQKELEVRKREEERQREIKQRQKEVERQRREEERKKAEEEKAKQKELEVRKREEERQIRIEQRQKEVEEKIKQREIEKQIREAERIRIEEEEENKKELKKQKSKQKKRGKKGSKGKRKVEREEEPLIGLDIGELKISPEISQNDAPAAAEEPKKTSFFEKVFGSKKQEERNFNKDLEEIEKDAKASGAQEITLEEDIIKPRDVYDNEEEIQKAIDGMANIKIPSKFEGLFKKKEPIKDAQKSTGNSGLFSSNYPKKIETPEVMPKTYDKIDNVGLIEEKMHKARIALMNFKFDEAKRIYIEIMKRYNKLDIKDRSKVYDDIKDLYYERKSAERFSK